MLQILANIQVASSKFCQLQLDNGLVKPVTLRLFLEIQSKFKEAPLMQELMCFNIIILEDIINAG